MVWEGGEGGELNAQVNTGDQRNLSDIYTFKFTFSHISLQLYRMQRIGETEWESDGILPVSFAPLINCKEDSKELLAQFIEIRKLIYFLWCSF